MGVYFNVNGWKKTEPNGFMLFEMLLAAALALVLLLAVLPAYTEAVRQEQRQVMSEELYRQGVVIDETFYHVLRYSKIISVTEKEIIFYTADGLKAGFRVSGTMIDRLLRNGDRQPLLSIDKNPMVHGRVVARPYEDRPYFSYDGRAVRIAILLTDVQTLQTWPCLITVVPWQHEERTDET